MGFWSQAGQGIFLSSVSWFDLARPAPDDFMHDGAVGMTIRGEPEQTSQIAITAFADIAEPVLAATRVLPGNEADPGREIAS